MTIGTDEKVVWLHVSMYPIHLVCFLDAENHFSHVLFGDLLAKCTFADEQAEKVSTDAEAHDEVKMLTVLKCGDERHNPFRAFSCNKEVPFSSQVAFLGVT